MSLINSIQKDWKYKLRHEIKNVHMESNLLKQIGSQTHVNKFVYNTVMRYSQGAVSKAEIKWNEQFPDETLQWKTITILNCAIFSIQYVRGTFFMFVER